jgi:hypothetical protein
MNIILNTYLIIALLGVITSLLGLIKIKKRNKDDYVILYIMLVHSFFDLFLWILYNEKERERELIGMLSYDLLFPIFLISIFIFKNREKYIFLSVIIISIASQFILKNANQIPVNGEIKIVLSLIACLILVYNVYKNLKKIRFQNFMLLLISGIPLFDMFYNAAIFKIISFEINTWKIFINSYIIFMSITCCIFIYYYGKQLLKNSSPTI